MKFYIHKNVKDVIYLTGTVNVATVHRKEQQHSCLGYLTLRTLNVLQIRSNCLA